MSGPYREGEPEKRKPRVTVVTNHGLYLGEFAGHVGDYVELRDVFFMLPGYTPSVRGVAAWACVDGEKATMNDVTSSDPQLKSGLEK